jgi:hypothetical protein
VVGDGIRSTARRGLLARGALLVAGAIGVGAAAKGGAAGAAGAATTVLHLTGRGWHLVATDRQRGELPQPGDRLSVFGELVDGKGEKVGDFYSACFCMPAPLDGQAANVELHNMTLPGGTLAAMGTATAGPNVFTIVGGTGRYQGATGSYRAEQRPFELGGDGTAEFVVTLTK